MSGMGRREFLCSLFGHSPATEQEGVRAVPDYEALLPSDFTPALLHQEAIRLGLDPAALSRRELAYEVLRHMGALPE